MIKNVCQKSSIFWKSILKNILIANEKPFTGIVYENYVAPKLRYSVKEGVKDGSYALYFENGQLRRKTSFEAGKYNGQYEEFYDNGQLKIKTSFKMGKYHGPLIMYYKNGQIEATGNHLEGQFDGVQKKYYQMVIPGILCLKMEHRMVIMQIGSDGCLMNLQVMFA